MHITKWKKPIWKGYTLYNSNDMTFWKRLIEDKKSQWLQKQKGREGWIGGVQGFLGQWSYSLPFYYDGYMAMYYLSNPIHCSTPRVNPLLTMNTGWWWCVMCQCGSKDCNKCTTIDSGGVGGGVGRNRNFLYLSFNFFCEPKTAL